MAADPTLADRLDERAEQIDLDIIERAHGTPSQAGEAAVWSLTLRRAAIELRRLERIEVAIGDVRQLRVDHQWCNDLADTLAKQFDEPTVDYLRSIGADLRRIADALGGDE